MRNLPGSKDEVSRLSSELLLPSPEANLPVQDVEGFIFPMVDMERCRHARPEIYLGEADGAPGLSRSALNTEERALPPDLLHCRNHGVHAAPPLPRIPLKWDSSTMRLAYHYGHVNPI